MWERLEPNDADGLYSAACYRAVTAGVFRTDPRIADAGPQADAEADKAMAWLKRAVVAGFNTPQRLAQMMRDSDLDAVRDRADFHRLMAELFDRGFPTDPFARRN
jgi:hypothetical protein